MYAIRSYYVSVFVEMLNLRMRRKMEGEQMFIKPEGFDDLHDSYNFV